VSDLSDVKVGDRVAVLSRYHADVQIVVHATPKLIHVGSVKFSRATGKRTQPRAGTFSNDRITADPAVIAQTEADEAWDKFWRMVDRQESRPAHLTAARIAEIAALILGGQR
jgi:hypothetical protein